MFFHADIEAVILTIVLIMFAAIAQMSNQESEYDIY